MTWRETLLIVLAVAAITAIALADPIPQDLLYHQFIDRREFVAIPNFLNVMSNLPFLFVGLAGMRFVQRQPNLSMRFAWLVFFLAVAATAFGSGYYHINPDNNSLVWDRLPMTVAFMSLASVIIAEYFSIVYAKRALGILLLLGIGSVFYWAYTEAQGRGDLRPYAVVQFLPMMLIPLILLMYPQRSDLQRYIWGMIFLYAAAKLAEHFDAQIFSAGNFVSGHSLKHLIASAAPLYLLWGLQRRVRGQSAADSA